MISSKEYVCIIIHSASSYTEHLPHMNNSHCSVMYVLLFLCMTVVQNNDTQSVAVTKEWTSCLPSYLKTLKFGRPERD